eukprot:3648746-Pleurochrysis_carterae.AAC.1
MPNAARKPIARGAAAAPAAAKPATAARRAPKHAAAPTADVASLPHLPVSARLRSSVKAAGGPAATEKLVIAGSPVNSVRSSASDSDDHTRQGQTSPRRTRAHGT